MNFIYKLSKFMYGRYGLDALSKFLLKLLFWVLMFNILIHHYVIFIIEIVLLIIILYRILSKKTYKRNRENQIYLKIKKKLLKPFNNIIRNMKDKEHVYKKCRSCKKTLKLPLPDKRGVKCVKCPNCGKKLKVFTLKYQKIEIIRKK